jgi:Zn-dependent oligopeptidase
MHNICTKAETIRFSGTATERDFVEAPSQMLENWCWEKESLKLMSSHHETGLPLPDDLIERMIAAKNVCVALLTLRQLFFGIFDFTLHSQQHSTLSTAEVWKELSVSVFGIPCTPGTNGSSSFGHIMGGYE